MSTTAGHDPGAGADAPSPGSTAPDDRGGLADLLDELSRLDGAALDDAARIDQLTALERAKAAVAAAQVRVTAAFAASQAQTSREWWDRARECADVGDFDGWRAARDRARAAALPGDDRRRAGDSDHDAASSGAASPGSRRRRPSAVTGVAAQVALARHESPVRGAAHLAMALALTTSMPCTLAALEAGELNEWRAQILVRETALLTDEQRRVVDAEVVGDPAEPVGALGDRELARRVQAVAYRLDAEAVLARARRAESERRVTLRPAPDTMAYLTALLPVAQAVAAYAALTAAADSARAGGDERSKGQVMADTLIARVTGQETADGVPVEVQLVMTDSALFHRAAAEQAAAAGSAPSARRRPSSSATARCPPCGPEHSSTRTTIRPTPRPRPGCGCGASTSNPTPGRSSPWTHAAASSTEGCAGSCSPGTPARAAPRGATHRPGTSTTCTTTPTAARRAPRTDRACACGATTPSSCPAGPRARSPHPATGAATGTGTAAGTAVAVPTGTATHRS
ncbi:hypothetical protein GCM10023258_38030 [Terrabacter aeriphilus]|uniref:DUF222 domain-containing protein n=1 Tax=Terrabacter aeriphilus TaxID=515662 RepID=A0ABP9JN82_9MICO